MARFLKEPMTDFRHWVPNSKLEPAMVAGGLVASFSVQTPAVRRSSHLARPDAFCLGRKKVQFL